jgi:hypothetical protein
VAATELGALGVWDFRLLHRGLPNLGARVRSVVYFTIGKAWWIDRSNAFPKEALFAGNESGVHKILYKRHKLAINQIE